MTTIASIISFVVLLLATSSFSAPLVPELQNATSVPQVENATGAFHFENLIVLARREAAEERSVKDTVGLSSSSSEDDTSKTDQTTERLTPREAEDEDSFSSFSEDKAEREANDDVETLADDDDNSNNERSVTEETFSSETNTKRGIEVDTFETSTVDRTFVAPSSEVKTVKRSSGSNGWLAEESNDEERTKRSSGSGGWLAEESNDEERAKRSSGSGGWLAEESNDEVQKRSIGDMKVSTVADETSTVEDFSVPSRTKVLKTRDAMDQPSSFAAEENADFNERAVGAIESSSVVPHVERDLQQSPSLSEEASEEFNRRAIGSLELEESSTIIAARILSESTTDEQPSSSTEVIREALSSTLESETTVTPVDDFTRSSPVSTTRKSKILAIIPGQISKGQLVINPATGKTAGFRPVHQVQLSQGQNQTVVEEKQPNY